MSNVIDRPLPFNIEAEEALLGSLMLSADSIVQVLPLLKTQDFYREKHAWLYDVLVSLHERHMAPDFVTIIDELERREQLDKFGGHAALSKLMNSVPTAIHLDHYARIVERDAKKRQLLAAAERIARMVYEEKEKDARELIEQAEQEIFAIGQHHLSGSLVPIKEILGDFYKQAEEMFMDHQPIGLATGFTDLDRLLGGLQRGDLITLAARPGMGKTQGCSVLKDPIIIEDTLEFHAIFKYRLAYISNLIVTEDVKSKAAQSSKNRRITANARFILS